MSEYHRQPNPPVPIAVHAYLDTVQMWLEKKPSNANLKAIKTMCGSCHVDQRPAYWNKTLRCRLMLHQPDPDAIRLLSRIVMGARIPFLLNRVDIALDLIASDYAALERLDDFFDRHLVKWHGSHRVTRCKTTRYTTMKSWQVQQLITYPTRRSKITGEPCLHLEWRAKGKAPVQRLGIRDPGQLIEFDHRAFWQKRFCLEEVDFTMLGKQACRQGRTKTPIPRGPYANSHLAVGHLIGQAADGGSQNGPTAQDVRDYCQGAEWFRPQTAMKRIDPEPYLPSCAL